jgi:hypothetical protein
MLITAPLQAVNVRFTDNNGGEFGGAAATAATVSFTQVQAHACLCHC